MAKPKSIFCIETYWQEDLEHQGSVRAFLELLHSVNGQEYLHHRCATSSEFKWLLEKWASEYTKHFPILYFAMHGSAGAISLTDCEFTFKEIQDLIKGRGTNTFIYFGTCETLSMDENEITSFCANTKCSAIIGYTKKIEWIQSAAVDLMVFEVLHKKPFTALGMNNLEKAIDVATGGLSTQIGLKVVLNEKYISS